MIYLERGAEPSGFAVDSERWLAEFIAERTNDSKLTAHIYWTRIRKHKALKAYAVQLSLAFRKKCVYCESKSEHVSASHIEHYLPKSHNNFERLMFVWTNWLIACARCNSLKGSYYEECNGKFCLIDPSTEKPNEHVNFLCAQVISLSSRGHKTIDKLQLNRSDLLDERGKWLNYIRSLLLILLKVPEAKAPARELLIWSLQDDAPYAAMTRAYLTEKTPKLVNPAQSHQIMKIDEPARRIAELIEEHSEQLQTVD